MNDRHKSTQTAFRIPEGLLAWLRDQAHLEQRPMTAILVDALRAYQQQVSLHKTAGSR